MHPTVNLCYNAPTMKPLTISTLTSHIATLFESDATMRDIWLTGEVSNWRPYRSGHIYFSLKDAGATLTAVMWKANAARQSWLPQEGDQIVGHGYVGVYPERGVYQFYADQIQPAGRGQLYAQFEALKSRLQAEGLFDSERKRPIPPSPRRLGIITSSGAAALRDILRVLSQRWPLVDVLLFPTLVQGSEAPANIVAAIQAANRYSSENEPIDCLILARGGGSIEDLWAFNDEGVAYALAASQLPVISGVGHEVDFTIADFVADLRAPTPSAAAAAAVPDRSEQMAQLSAIQQGFRRNAVNLLVDQGRNLARLQLQLQRAHPRRQLDLRRQELDDKEQRLQRVVAAILQRNRERMVGAGLRLDALNPSRVLERGYSIVQNSKGQIITGPQDAEPGDELTVRGSGGDYRVQRLLI